MKETSATVGLDLKLTKGDALLIPIELTVSVSYMTFSESTQTHPAEVAAKAALNRLDVGEHELSVREVRFGYPQHETYRKVGGWQKVTKEENEP